MPVARHERPRRDTVLFVSCWGQLGGAQISLLTALATLRSPVRAVLAAPDEGVLIDRVARNALVDEHVVVPPPRFNERLRSRAHAAAILLLWSLKNRGRLLAVHANGDAELKLLLPTLLVLRVPVVVWYHAREMSTSTARLAPLWRILRRRIIWAPVSESSLRLLASVGIGTQDNVAVVPNPVDPEVVLVHDPRARDRSRPLVVGYLGCENVAKGILLLPEIVEQLRDADIRVLCVTKGWPPQRNAEAVNDALDRLRELQPMVEFRVRDFDVRNIFADIDVLLVPSLSESFCRIAAEAMLNGIPVVASDLPAVREVCGDGDAALLFEIADVNGAASCVQRLIDQPELVAKLADAGMRRARDFTPDRVGEDLLRLYRRTLPVNLRDQTRRSE